MGVTSQQRLARVARHAHTGCSTLAAWWGRSSPGVGMGCEGCEGCPLTRLLSTQLEQDARAGAAIMRSSMWCNLLSCDHLCVAICRCDAIIYVVQSADAIIYVTVRARRLRAWPILCEVSWCAVALGFALD